MYKEDLAINYLQWLICHKTQSTNPPTNVLKQNDTDICQEPQMIE